MSKPALKAKGYTVEDIPKLFRKDERYTIGIRFYEVHQVDVGKASHQLEVFYNTSFKQITNEVHLLKQVVLKDKPKSRSKRTT